jgi:hypothetical protein
VEPGFLALLALDVLLRDEVGIPPRILQEARAVTTGIFEEAGIDIAWLDPESARTARDRLQAADERAFLEGLYTVRIVADATGSHPGVPPGASLGLASPGTRQARALYRRIERRAQGAGVPTGVVLGHVMAHELGHLVLRRSAHGTGGVMQALLDVTRAAQGRLGFTSEEAALLRARVRPP